MKNVTVVNIVVIKYSKKIFDLSDIGTYVIGKYIGDNKFSIRLLGESTEPDNIEHENEDSRTEYEKFLIPYIKLFDNYFSFRQAVTHLSYQYSIGN